MENVHPQLLFLLPTLEHSVYNAFINHAHFTQHYTIDVRFSS